MRQLERFRVAVIALKGRGFSRADRRYMSSAFRDCVATQEENLWWNKEWNNPIKLAATRRDEVSRAAYRAPNPRRFCVDWGG